MSKLTTTNIVGTASKTTWSQAQTIIYQDEHQIMVVLEIGCAEDDSLVDLVTIGVEILSEIEKKGQVVEDASQLIAIVNEVITGITEGLRIGILISSLQKEKLIIAGYGSMGAYLARKGEVARLGNKWAEGQSIEGMLKSGDKIILSTNKFIETVGLAKFKKIVIKDDHPEELLAPLLHTQADSSGVAAIVGIATTTKNFTKWPRIKLRGEKPREINLFVGGGIFILLIIMIGIGMVRRVGQVAEREFLSLSSSINAKVEEARSIGDLNPDRARHLFSQSKNEVTAYLMTDIREEYKIKGNKLIEEIALADEQTFKKNEIKLSIVAELGVLIEGLKADQMKSDGKDNLIFLDIQKSRIVEMNLLDRSRQIIDIKDNEKYIDLGVGEARVHGLRFNGVTEFTWGKDSTKKVIEADEFWENPTYIEMFARNAYILDKEQGEIWKYPTLGDTFGGRRRWFAVGITPDLTNVVDMKIVNDVWILTSTGKLERYSRGAPVQFGMEGFPALGEPKRLSDPVAVWVTESLIYVVERGASRIVVFGVDGKYRSQYVNTEFAKASDLVVVDNKAYVLIDNTVKEFGL